MTFEEKRVFPLVSVMEEKERVLLYSLTLSSIVAGHFFLSRDKACLVFCPDNLFFNQSGRNLGRTYGNVCSFPFSGLPCSFPIAGPS